MVLPLQQQHQFVTKPEFSYFYQELLFKRKWEYSGRIFGTFFNTVKQGDFQKSGNFTIADILINNFILLLTSYALESLCFIEAIDAGIERIHWE